MKSPIQLVTTQKTVTVSQSAITIGAILGAFVLWLASQDRLKTYLGIIGL